MNCFIKRIFSWRARLALIFPVFLVSCATVRVAPQRSADIRVTTLLEPRYGVNHEGLAPVFTRPEGPTVEVVGTNAATWDSQRLFHKKSWYRRTEHRADFAFDLRRLPGLTRPDLAGRISRSWIQLDTRAFEPTEFGSLPVDWLVHITSANRFENNDSSSLDDPRFPAEGRTLGDQSVMVRIESVEGTRRVGIPGGFLSAALERGDEALWIRLEVANYPNIADSDTGVRALEGGTHNIRTRNKSSWLRIDELDRGDRRWTFRALHTVRPQLGIRYFRN